MADNFVFAFCWATGAIGFARKVPRGAIGIARGPRTTLRNLVEGTARLAYDNKTLLVPGIPEAPNQTRGIVALHEYMKWIAKHDRVGVKVLMQEGA